MTLPRLIATVAPVLTALVLLLATAESARGQQPETFFSKWLEPSVRVVYNWDESLCVRPSDRQLAEYPVDPQGPTTPTVEPQVMTDLLREVIATLNQALGGGLVLVDGGPGAADGHCLYTRDTGDIAIGWSPIHPAHYGFVTYHSQWTPAGTGLKGAGVVLSTAIDWSPERCPDAPYALLRHTMMHELLHALGMMHSFELGSLMYPTPDAYSCRGLGRLQPDDHERLWREYPRPDGVTEWADLNPPTPPRQAPPTIRGPVARGGVGLAMTEGDVVPMELVELLMSQGCEPMALAVTIDGRIRPYIVGAPAFVNAQFPPHLAAGTPFIYRCYA